MSIWEIVAYVSNGNGFWGSMGFATATAMIIGALLYDLVNVEVQPPKAVR